MNYNDNIIDGIDIDNYISSDEIKEDHNRLRNTIHYHFHSLSVKQVDQLINLILQICTSCHNNSHSCLCWNDD